MSIKQPVQNNGNKIPVSKITLLSNGDKIPIYFFDKSTIGNKCVVLIAKRYSKKIINYP